MISALFPPRDPPPFNFPTHACSGAGVHRHAHTHASQFSFVGTAIDRPLLASDGFLSKYAFPAEAALASR